LDRGLEGWVEIAFTISADGAVVSPRVTAAEPLGTFDKSALNAIAQWRYAPSGERDHLVVVAFSMLDGAAARAPVMDQLTEASRAIQSGDLAAAEKQIEKVADTGGLTLAELTVLERVRGLLDYRRGLFAAAARRYNRVLEIFGARMEPAGVRAVLESLLPAHINAGEFAAAVAAADRWLPDREALPEPLAQAMDSIRLAVAAGRPIRLAPAP
jgi:TonB family protein